MEKITTRLTVTVSCILFLILFGCRRDTHTPEALVLWEPYNDSLDIADNAAHENPRMRYKLVESKFLDKNALFRPLYAEVKQLDSLAYQELAPLILEKSIPEIQHAVREGKLSYEDLVRFFLYRIYLFELDHHTTLNTIIALNSEIIEEARDCDRQLKLEPNTQRHPIFGMPILLKDNINTASMPTTAGSVALIQNNTDDAYIVSRLKENGAIILGKVNLSEWAYYLCRGCPVGYSAVGGQTLNPYGRKIFETGGSSSGSGTAVAANYAVAAVGTETSGSILSPSSQNSVVGLKPTIGSLSRSGIVPISSTLDTPGPMTKNVVDNLILFTAMKGKDALDTASIDHDLEFSRNAIHNTRLEGRRFGAFSALREQHPIYDSILRRMEDDGAVIVDFTPPEVAMDGFLTILNIDMKHDLPRYLKAYVKNKDGVKISGVADAVQFNAADSLNRIPYGQQLFENILADSTTAEALTAIKNTLQENGRRYFEEAMTAHNLDAVLSINNYHAGYAAVAKYPALTVPMGYKPTGEPISLTFIGRPFTEAELYRDAAAFEKLTAARRMPALYR